MEQGPQFDDLFHATTHRFKFGEVVEPRGDYLSGDPTAWAGSSRDARDVAQSINTSGKTGTGAPTTGRKARVYKVVPVDSTEAQKTSDSTSVRSSKGFRVVRRVRRLER
jgi:hypothetical protein